MSLNSTSPVLFTNASPVGGVAGQAVVEVAAALLAAVVSKLSGIALPVASFARPTGGAGAGSVLGIAGGIVLAVAQAGAVLPVVVQVAWPVTLDVLPPSRAQALPGFRHTLCSVLAVAAQGAILPKSAGQAAFLTGGSAPPRGTQAGSVHGRALGPVLAVARLLAVQPEAQERARPGALGTAPADAALTLAGLRVTLIRVLHIALAGTIAVRPELVRRANALLAPIAAPARVADAGPGGSVAGGVVGAVALLGAVQSVGIQLALVEAALALVARRALALTGYVVAWRSLVALAGLLASWSVGAYRTLVGTHVARPAGIAHAGPGLRLTLSVILAGAVLLALSPVLPVRAVHVASSLKRRISRRLGLGGEQSIQPRGHRRVHRSCN